MASNRNKQLRTLAFLEKQYQRLVRVYAQTGNRVDWEKSYATHRLYGIFFKRLKGA
ncbi:hypothetical protein ACWIUA_00385 [Ursidibacter sp. B-7004-1]